MRNALAGMYWEFGRAEGDSFGKVGMGMRLIDASNGSIVWKGGTIS